MSLDNGEFLRPGIIKEDGGLNLGYFFRNEKVVFLVHSGAIGRDTNKIYFLKEEEFEKLEIESKEQGNLDKLYQNNWPVKAQNGKVFLTQDVMRRFNLSAYLQVSLGKDDFGVYFRGE